MDSVFIFASHYYNFSHKAYVASPKKPSQDISAKIKNAGLGFLWINPEKNMVEEVIEPCLNEPREDTMIYWLNESFKVYRCRICGNFVRKDKAKEGSFIGEISETTVLCNGCGK